VQQGRGVGKEENRTRMAPAQAPRPERQGRLAPHGAPARRWRSSVVEAGQGSAESVENARRGKRRRGVFVTRDEKRPVTTLSAKGCAGAKSTGCRKPQGFTTSLATTGPSRALPSLGRMYGIVTLRCAYSEQLRACTPARVRSREGAAGGRQADGQVWRSSLPHVWLLHGVFGPLLKRRHDHLSPDTYTRISIRWLHIYSWNE